MTARLDELFRLLPPCRKFADVGCDHGYIAARMLASGKCERLVVSDISMKSLDKARALLAERLPRAERSRPLGRIGTCPRRLRSRPDRRHGRGRNCGNSQKSPLSPADAVRSAHEECGEAARHFGDFGISDCQRLYLPGREVLRRHPRAERGGSAFFPRSAVRADQSGRAPRGISRQAERGAGPK